ncbi:MAG: AAA family ATPase [Streptosporangiales bacterium]|nr:AAA family ATPase [Streptosporangiales bacterium]
MHPQSPAPGEPGRPKAELIRMTDVAPERIDWLWPGYLARGKLHVVDGDPGLGKSTVTMDWAARVTAGKPWPDGQAGGDTAGVVIMSAEDGLGDTIRPRLGAGGADLDQALALTGIGCTDPATGEPGQRLPELPTDTELVRDALRQVDAALLVIDPLMAYLAPSVNAHRDQDIRRALAPLMRAAEDAGAAVVLVRHLTKGDGASAIYRGGGSIGIIGAARLGFTVARHPDDPQNAGRAVIAGTKANITATPASLAYHLVDDPDNGCARVEWEGTVDYSADDLLRPPATTPTGGTQDTAAQWLTTYLTDQGGEAPLDDLLDAAREAGIPERTLYRSRTRAGVLSERTGYPARAVWRLSTPPAETAGSAAAPDAGGAGSTGGTGGTGSTGSTGRTETPAIGPCARCQRPTRRYGDHATGTLCAACRTSQGGTA